MKSIKNISDLVIDDDYLCYINPFNDKSHESKAESIASFIEKKNRINKISIKIKNRKIREKLNSLVSRNNEEMERQRQRRNTRLTLKKLYPSNSVKNLNLFSYNLKINKDILKLIPFNLKTSKSSSKINFLNDYEKYFFSDVDYSNLEYNATEIFKNSLRYRKIIKEKIILSKKCIFDKKTIKLEKQFRYGNDGKKINLSLTTLTIDFEEMGAPPEKQNKNLHLNLPISLLPFFYYKGIDCFQKLLAYIVKVGKNFESVRFDEKAFEIAVNNIPDYQINLQKINSLDVKLEYEDLKSPILKRKGNFLNFNTFIFFWITNTKNFVTKITLPCIHLDILDNNISIKNYIDYELLFFLFEKDFQYWEFYVMKYLSTYSKYRNIFEQLDRNDKINNQIYYFKEPKTKINTFSQETLYNIYTDQNYINQVMVFSSFYLVVNLIDEIYSLKKNYRIYFSFFQYVKLYEIAKYSNKIGFLSKFINVDTETHTLTFNFREYDEFDANIWMENIKKFAGNSLKKNSNIEEESDLHNEFGVYNKKVKIEYIKPLWSILKLVNGKEISRTWRIGKEMEIYLIESIVNPNGGSWSKFLNECLEKLESDEDSSSVSVDVNDIKQKITKKIK